MNYVSYAQYTDSLNNFKQAEGLLKESKEDDLCPNASHHEWKKVGSEKAKCEHCGMTKAIAYGYEPERSFEYGEKNKMREGVSRMSESRRRFESIRQNLSPEDQEQLREYMDTLKEVKRTIKELLLKGSKRSSDEHRIEEGGDMMHKRLKIK